LLVVTKNHNFFQKYLFFPKKLDEAIFPVYNKKSFEKYDKMLLMGRVHEEESLRELSGAARQCVSLMEDQPGETDAKASVR